MIDPRRSLLVAWTLSLAACGGIRGGEVVRPRDPAASQALGEKSADCKLAVGYAEALVVDWDANARLDLEAGMRTGLVPVRYTCDEFRIVKGCSVRGDYGYVGVSRKEQVIKIGNDAEVRANFKIGVGQYEAAVERGSAIDLAMVLVGKRSSTSRSVTRDLAEGACDDATHVVTASTIGAFAVATGSSGVIAAAADVFQLGKAGASTSSSKQALSRDGELEACQTATPSDASPPEQCQSAIKVELLPILAPPQASAAAADGDADGDAIADPDDKCPTAPENRNGYQDDDGCPDEIPVALAMFTGTIKGIDFDGNDASIKTKSQPVLDRAVQALKELPTIRIEISGHTSVGEDRKLGQRRADTVRDYLIARGVARARIEVRSGGEDEQIDTNKTSVGRAKNRRIEFTILTNDYRAPPPPPKDALKNPCPPGNVFADGKCTTAGAATSYQCELEDSATCEAQCDKGNMPSCYQLARALSGNNSGVTIAPDKPRSNALKKRACEGDVAAACNGYAVELLYPDSGNPSKNDIATARGVLERACVELGHALACISLADEYRESKGLFGTDGKKYLEYYQRACNLGDADGCDAVGGIYARGNKTVPRDLAAAEAAWMRSCQGDTDTGRCVLFGELLAAGKDGFRKDPSMAMWLFRRGCAVNALSCKELGDAYARGVDGPPDPARAKQAYARACTADRADDEVCAKAK